MSLNWAICAVKYEYVDWELYRAVYRAGLVTYDEAVRCAEERGVRVPGLNY